MTNENREVIERTRAAIADIDRLCADTVGIINHSSQLLRLIDQMSKPLIGAITDRDH
jgi:hypothetical protein